MLSSINLIDDTYYYYECHESVQSGCCPSTTMYRTWYSTVLWTTVLKLHMVLSFYHRSAVTSDELQLKLVPGTVPPFKFSIMNLHSQFGHKLKDVIEVKTCEYIYTHTLVFFIRHRWDWILNPNPDIHDCFVGVQDHICIFFCLDHFKIELTLVAVAFLLTSHLGFKDDGWRRHPRTRSYGSWHQLFWYLYLGSQHRDISWTISSGVGNVCVSLDHTSADIEVVVSDFLVICTHHFIVYAGAVL